MSEHIFQIKGAEQFYNDLVKSSPEWFVAYRNKCLEESRNIPIPSVKDEEWKYTNLALLNNNEYTLPPHFDLKDPEQLWQYADKRDINFVMVNGCFISELSNVDDIDGLEAMHLQEAANHGRLTEEHFTVTTKNDIQPFLAINGAYHRCGAYIKISKAFKSERMIHIININTSDKPYSISPRNIILTERSSQAAIMESHISLTNAAYFVNPLTDIYLEENAVVEYTKAQNDSKEAIHISQTRVWQERDSQFHGFSYMHGAKLTRNNLTITLNGEGTYSMLDGLYILNQEQHADNHSLVNNLHPNCETSQLYKGILNDASRAVFNGKIYVDAIAQKTNAYQLNKNLLLGKKARIDTKPQLEIFADDVKCTHGATIGQLVEDEVFYLQTRCIPREAAVRMIAYAFAAESVDNIKSEVMRKRILALVEEAFAELNFNL